MRLRAAKNRRENDRETHAIERWEHRKGGTDPGQIGTERPRDRNRESGGQGQRDQGIGTEV